jgi:hypothetical protein
MVVESTPMWWPGGWVDPSLLALLDGSAINCLLVGQGAELDPVRSRAQELGIKVVHAESLPADVEIIKGVWPGVTISGSGGLDQISAGPTGAAWVDSNGWAIRLARATRPDATVWVDAAPTARQSIAAEPYQVAIADSSAHGGRWIVTLDRSQAEALAARQPAALGAWKKIAAATRFFADHRAWAGYVPVAKVGVVSDFAGPDEFFNRELLNLLARTGAQYRILPKDKISDTSFRELRAVIYADSEPPVADLRARMLAWVRAGGLLITVPKCGDLGGAPAAGGTHPGFSLRVLGSGRIAQSKTEPDDPSRFASDSVVLVSHRYDLVRLWNGGATAAYYTMAPDKSRALVHLLFFAGRGADEATVRVMGHFRTAAISTIDSPAPRKVRVEPQGDAVEVYLPPVSQYVALELVV